ncbi:MULTISPECIES: AAA family ATPase [unclassified Variovorax]|uniref:AAA family ATPase n=1 Tax=unclassified Variovorax TaxID=663243 RepID=UPI00076C73A4|nr:MULTISPECIES: AAA family ATPase [unclassified Variovorax]KWT98359.1 hypothetical protein APY03_0494 [Variovorax sp. WDL1]PNG49982.1 hypothetical protein CHC06_05563 [Variovorax sp. B2]PNG50854.1 hypothetical protein CHC07_05468 [Variovorax sp. B4]VTU41691.1 hypothetical protein H6P1_00027 [Variovorax sp. PBL-H6]VTU44610.1 hypothetical protein SRS16P1_00876 [Variovorax sp. SRS16]
MKVINLFAAPGIGKSTSAQILTGLLSIGGYRVEYVPEFAKFQTFSGNQAALSDQVYMFAKQENRLHVFKDQEFDFVVMDGPLPIALLYTPETYFKYYEPLVMEVFSSFDNVNFFLDRNPSYEHKKHGRIQDRAQSDALSLRLEAILSRHKVPLTREMVRPQLPLVLYEALTGAKPPSLEDLA